MPYLNARSRYFLLVALLALAPTLMDQESHPDPSSAQISAVLRAQQDAWNRGDVRAFMDGYWNSPEVTFSGSAGITRG